MSFRQFGGLQFASKHNAVSSYYNTSNNLLVTQNVGQSNSYINFLSDISGNTLGYAGPTGDFVIGPTGGFAPGPIGPTGPSYWQDMSSSTGIYYNDGNVAIGKTTASATLDVSGNVIFSGNVNATSYTTTSDYRIKENVKQLDEKFIIDKLNPVKYLNNNLGKQDIGLIAHELQDIYPELVNGEKDGNQLQSVNYTGLIPILIKEIQDLKKSMKSIKEEVNELKNKIDLNL